jgi:DNA topoisomerase-2
MADQDHDGSHIKALFINVLHYYWPSLLIGDGYMLHATCYAHVLLL